MLDDNRLSQVDEKNKKRQTHTTLLLINYPPLINKVEVMPPLTDIAHHNVVYINVSTKACINKQTPRTVYLYHRVDWPAVKDDVAALFGTMINNTSRSDRKTAPMR